MGHSALKKVISKEILIRLLLLLLNVDLTKNFNSWETLVGSILIEVQG